MQTAHAAQPSSTVQAYRHGRHQEIPRNGYGDAINIAKLYVSVIINSILVTNDDEFNNSEITENVRMIVDETEGNVFTRDAQNCVHSEDFITI